MLYEILCKELNPRSGKIQEMPLQNKRYWKGDFDVSWKGDFHFIVVESLFRRGGHYYVDKNKQSVSPTYWFNKIDNELLKKMQRMIDEIDSGKYRNKKTLTEKIHSLVEQKGLVSYMNNTKWNELFNAINENIPYIDLQYKTIFDDESPDVYWELYGDEEIEHMNFGQIEWLKIKPTKTEYTHIGMLVSPQIRTYDKYDEILKILHQYNISYEYDETEQVFVIYGYK